MIPALEARRVATRIAAVAITASMLVLAALAARTETGSSAFAATAADETTVVDRVYPEGSNVGIHFLELGVVSVHVDAIGGRGETRSDIAGGLAARVEGWLPVADLSQLFVAVGGNGSGGVGGWNGGGAGGTNEGSDHGGGGGGASDVRSMTYGLPGSEATRLLIAGGGGGAGGPSLNSAEGIRYGAVGGAAGQDAATAGGRGANATPTNTIGSGGFGGGGATADAAGTPGGRGFMYFEWAGSDGSPGQGGQGPYGGSGGSSPVPTGTGMGGGGGGGLFGGGGGGGGIWWYDTGPNAYFSGGGGGGGGASLVPEGGTFAMAAADSAPAVRIDYTIPGTEITSGPPAVSKQTSVAFEIRSTEEGSSLECSLDGSDFSPCSGTEDIDGLGDGEHQFRARAVNSKGNYDATPAEWAFTVDTSDPPDPPGPPDPPDRPNPPGVKPRLTLGKAKLNLRKGIAVVPARVSVPGKLRLLGSKRVRPQAKTVRKSGVVRLKVRLKPRAKRQLRRRGRTRVGIRVRLNADGSKLERKRKVVLRLKKRR